MYAISERFRSRLPPSPLPNRCKERKIPPKPPKTRVSLIRDEDIQDTRDIHRPEVNELTGAVIRQRSFAGFVQEFDISAKASGCEPCPSNIDIDTFLRTRAPTLLNKPLYLFGNPHPNFKGRLEDLDEVQQVNTALSVFRCS